MPIDLNFGLAWEYQGKRGTDVLFHTAMLKLKDGISDWTPAFEFIAEDILEPFVAKQFLTQGAEGGLHWQRIAESTKRKREFPEASVLFQTDVLERSFAREGAGHVREITPKRLRWGSSVPHAVFHQTGTGKGYQQERVQTGPGTGRGEPMRKIIVLTEKMKQQVRSKFTGRIAKVAQGAGFRLFGREGIGRGEARRIGMIALGNL